MASPRDDEYVFVVQNLNLPPPPVLSELPLTISRDDSQKSNTDGGGSTTSEDSSSAAGSSPCEEDMQIVMDQVQQQLDQQKSHAPRNAPEEIDQLHQRPPNHLMEEQVPQDMPFLPPLEASAEIVMHAGYMEAIQSAQAFLDSRLLAYSQYQLTTREDENPVIHPLKLDVAGSSTTRFEHAVIDRPVTVCMGWQQVSGVSNHDRKLLRVLEEEGVAYIPHDISYSVKYLAPVRPNGDCLFLSMEQLLLYSEDCEPLPSWQIRHVATQYFMAYYRDCSPQDQSRIDTTIRNLYFPSLKGGWGVSPVQTRRFVALRSERNALWAKCQEVQRRFGLSRLGAAEQVFMNYAQPVVDANSYCDYMNVGDARNQNKHFLLALNYCSNGLVSMDFDMDDTRVAWGDDLVLESLATAYQRDLFVVLLGGGQCFFLPHRPRPWGDAEKKLATKLATTIQHGFQSKGNAPWFLLMRSTGGERGGDHYEPMYADRLRGDGSEEFGTIGD